MKNSTIKLIYILLLLLSGAIASCKTDFSPPNVANPGSYLVVEGTINTGSADSTIFKLSRTVKLSISTTTAMETGAQVSVQDAAGKSYALKEIRAGVYAAPPLGLAYAGSYRLSIKRANGSAYQSDLVQAKASPPIDSVDIQAATDGAHISLSTHDPANNSRYYRWSYTETWQFHSAYISQFIVLPTDSIAFRTANQQVYYCFNSDVSNNIILNSTTKLTQDVVTQQPLTVVDPTGNKLNYIYSIQVKQYALTPEAFNFWQNLKKNTEGLGSIFDAQPSQLTGNIHNTGNAAEPVIGYVSAGTVATKRAYFKRNTIDPVINAKWADPLNASCQLDTLLYEYSDPKVPNSPIVNQVANYLYPHLLTPVYAITQPGTPKILGYISSTNECADCTIRGTTLKPSFWPY